MRSMFFEVKLTVDKAIRQSGFTLSRILSVLGIVRSWYYRQLNPGLILETRFNAFVVRDDDEWIVVGYKRRNPRMSFREIAYTLMDEDLAYLSPSSVYAILKKHDMVTSWKTRLWASKKADKPEKPDELWQTDIMYVKITGRFYYLLIFIDAYSRYIVHHKLLVSMDGDSIATEAQIAIEILRKDSLADPDIQSDNGSGFISMEFKIVLKANNLTHKRIKPHTPTDNAIIERANRTVREELETDIVSDFQGTEKSIDHIVQRYNNERRHSSLNYLPPREYYRGEPDVRIAVREAKIEMAKRIRRENNMKDRNGGEAAGVSVN